VNVKPGNAVRWTNNDFVIHTVTEYAKKFDSGILGPGQIFEQTFDKSGIIKYYCTIHPYMAGQVVVK
jgi:nitrite reductase (NO-forming)